MSRGCNFDVGFRLFRDLLYNLWSICCGFAVATNQSKWKLGLTGSEVNWRTHSDGQSVVDVAVVDEAIVQQQVCVAARSVEDHHLEPDDTRVHPYLTLPSARAGYHTCPALRPYQFGPMRSPDVTIRSQWSAVKPKSAVKPNKSPATWDWWRVVWLFLSGGLRLVSSSPSD